MEYWNGASDNLSQPFLLIGKEIRTDFNSLKKQIKNKRKPTDIIFFTDGFSYSATGILLKFLQYNGGGITVGYLGNPNKGHIPFDSSLSPSVVIEKETLQNISEEYKTLYDNYTYELQFSSYQTFYDPKNMTVPLEYVITPVDEIEPFYEYFSNKNYYKFINISKRIFDKYKTQCNPKNKKLVLVDSKCDKYFNNTYTHGGYECGDDGQWTSNCIATYCDIGYYFNHNNNTCVIDPCHIIEKDEDNYDFYVILIIIIGCVILLALAIFLIVFIGLILFNSNFFFILICIFRINVI